MGAPAMSSTAPNNRRLIDRETMLHQALNRDAALMNREAQPTRFDVPLAAAWHKSPLDRHFHPPQKCP
jgi:hypothetical protein